MVVVLAIFVPVATVGVVTEALVTAGGSALCTAAGSAGTSGGVAVVIGAGTATTGATTATATVAAVAISGPVAIAGLVVGAGSDGITWDCWKQVVHDSSVEASSGIHLSDLLAHDNVASISITDTGIFIANKFNETF